MSHALLEERPPTANEVQRALDAYIAAVRVHYGPRLHDIQLFGSRARGDARPDSDADVAVIINDNEWQFWQEKMLLADLTYEPLIEEGLVIQPWPVSLRDWRDPAQHHNPRFIEAIKRDGRSLLVPT